MTKIWETPLYYGPTWQRDESGEFILPEYTLGWEIAGWCTKYLLDPNDDSKPWKFTFEQLRFILWFYAVDGDGKFLHRDSVLQRMKGWGKDPLAAVMSLVELVGPCRFSHWQEADGALRPVAKPVPSAWVEIYGVSRESTVNTVQMIPLLVSERLRSEYGVNPGKEVIYANGGRSSLRVKGTGIGSSEGGRVTFMVLGEIQHWTHSNGGHDLFDTVRKNAIKTSGRFIAVTNAYRPGQESVGERLRDAWEKSQADMTVERSKTLYDSVEAHPDTPLTREALRVVLPRVAGDAVWTAVEEIIDSILDPSSNPAHERRMWLNQIVAADEQLVAHTQWDGMSVEGESLRPGDGIVLGFDGGDVSDATALVAIRVSDGLVQPLLIEERPTDWPTGPSAPRWMVDRDRVDVAVANAFGKYKVFALFCDLRFWESHVSQWVNEFGHRVVVDAGGRNKFAWDMRGKAEPKVAAAHEYLLSLIEQRGLLVADLEVPLHRHLRAHVLNAYRRETRHGILFGKETRDSPRKIDGYAALVAAAAALRLYKEKHATTKSSGSSAWWGF